MRELVVGGWSRITGKAVWLAGLTVLIPTVALAQSAIVGVVKDSSGAVLPGVTVEASSDVLIEKVKSATTDEGGNYRIADLRPGVYSVVFTMPGFNTFRRDDLRLSAEFTASIDATLAVGALEETITVTGASPVVDVTTAAHTATLDREAIDVIPTGRSIQGMAQLVVGINLSLPDTGGARAMQQTYMNTHGMAAANVSVLVDGMMVNGLQADGAVQSYFNDAMNSEVSYQTAGISAETAAGGVRLNMIPREGGNRFSGDFKMASRPGDWQSDNLTERHIDRGLEAGNATDRIIDYTFALGGPIMKDKLWFFTSARYFSVNNFIANTFFDDGSQGVDDQAIKSAMARLTWQASPRNKITAYFDEVDKYRGHDMQSNYDPETASYRWFSPAYHTTSVKWSSPFTSRMFLEAGWSSNLEYYTNSYQEGVEEPRGTAAWFAKASRNDLDLGNLTTAPQSRITESPARYAMMGAVTYLLGQHNLKFGMQSTWGSFTHTRDANGDLVQQYRSTSTGIPFTVPDSVLVRNTPLNYGERLNYDLGFFAQDSWTFNRLTINAGLRYEKVKAQVLAAESPAGRFVPARSFEPIENLPNWSNFAPRFATVYDLFGNGKTALKYSINRYNLARTTGIASQYNPLLNQTATLAVARRQRRRHRPGRARLQLRDRRDPRLRDQLRPAVLELRDRGAGHLWGLPEDVEPRAGRRDPARAAAQPVVGGQLVPRRLQGPDRQPQPELVDRGLHALHAVRPAHRRAVHRLRAERGRAGAAREIPRHLRSGTEAPVRGIQSGVPVSPLRRCPAVRRSIGRADARDVLYRAGRPELRVHLRHASRRRSSTPSACATRPSSTSRGGTRVSCRPRCQSAGGSPSARRSSRTCRRRRTRRSAAAGSPRRGA